MKKELNPLAYMALISSLAGWLALLIVFFIRQTAYQDQPLYAFPALLLLLSVIFGIKGRKSEYTTIARFGLWLTLAPVIIFVVITAVASAMLWY